jgi:hypothetical protein
LRGKAVGKMIVGKERHRLTELRKMGYIVANGILLYPACALIIFADKPLYATSCNRQNEGYDRKPVNYGRHLRDAGEGSLMKMILCYIGDYPIRSYGLIVGKYFSFSGGTTPTIRVKL